MSSLGERWRNHRSFIRDVRRYEPDGGFGGHTWSEDPNWRVNLREFASQHQGLDYSYRDGAEDDIVVTNTAIALWQVQADRPTQREMMRTAYLTAVESREEYNSLIRGSHMPEEVSRHRKKITLYKRRAGILGVQLNLLGSRPRDPGEIQAMQPDSNVLLFHRRRGPQKK